MSLCGCFYSGELNWCLYGYILVYSVGQISFVCGYLHSGELCELVSTVNYVGVCILVSYNILISFYS